jgi:hypothetical protein
MACVFVGFGTRITKRKQNASKESLARMSKPGVQELGVEGDMNVIVG